MKKNKKDKFLEELALIPNISSACEKTGISRNTIYRWRSEDADFSTALEEALLKGTESISDLAEGKVIQKIQQGERWAIRYWLDNNNFKYVKPREKVSLDGNIAHPTTERILIAKTTGINIKKHQNVIIEVVDMSHNPDFVEFDEAFMDKSNDENKKP